MSRTSHRLGNRRGSRNTVLLALRGNKSRRGAKRGFFLDAHRMRRAFVPALWVALPLLGIWMLKLFFFERNPYFTLNHIVIHTGETVSEASVREITGIERGRNLFDIEINEIRRNFLANAHHVRNIQITRVLPDRLVIRVIERHPVARIGRRGDLVVDEQGLVFVRRGELGMLPMLVGGRRAQSGSILVVSEEPIAIEPGKRLSGNAMAGIEALVLNGDPAFRLPVVEVDVSRLDYVALHLEDGREISLSWSGMGLGTSRSREHLVQRLRGVTDTLANPAARAVRYFDATVDDRHVIGRYDRSGKD